MAGGSLASAAVAPLFNGMNWAQAYAGTGTPRILQSWPRRGNTVKDPIWTYTAGVDARVCRWRIPDTRGATALQCYAWGSSVGGGGTIEWRSTVEGAVTGMQALPAAAGLIGPFALTIDASGGYEEVCLWANGGGGAVAVDAVMCRILPVSSPLAAAPASGVVPYDEDEYDPDEPLSADSGRTLIAGIETVRAVPHVYWQWSGVIGTTMAHEGKYMRSTPHVMPCPVWIDTDREEWDLDVHVFATSLVGDSEIRVHVAAPWDGVIRTLTLEVAGGAADAWYTGTLRLARRRVVRRLAPGLRTVLLSIIPEPTAAGADERFARITGYTRRDMTTARVRSVSVWGV
jgi:hypothetical protein